MNLERGQVVTILAGAGLILLVLELARRRRLREEHALPWLATALVILVLGIMPRLLWIVAPLLGVQYPPILLPVAGVLLLMLVVLSQGMAISGLSRRNRDLAQQLAILGLQLTHVQREIGRLSGSSFKDRGASPEPADLPVVLGDRHSDSVDNQRRMS